MAKLVILEANFKKPQQQLRDEPSLCYNLGLIWVGRFLNVSLQVLQENAKKRRFFTNDILKNFFPKCFVKINVSTTI